MDQKQDYKEKYEKRKIHTMYLCIIACILVVISLAFALGGDENALGQISMASTVSSIILSSIAIFMSISGENKLNYTHNKLIETSDRMSGITANIEHANSLLDGTIDQKLLKLDEISDRLEQIGQSVNNVEKEMLNKTTLDMNKESTATISSNILWEIYDNMVKEQCSPFDQMAKAVIEYIIVCCEAGARLKISSMEKYLKTVTGASNLYYEGFVWGVVRVFIYNGIMKEENIKYFEEKMKLSQAEKDEIKKFL